MDDLAVERAVAMYGIQCAAYSRGGLLHVSTIRLALFRIRFACLRKRLSPWTVAIACSGLR